MGNSQRGAWQKDRRLKRVTLRRPDIPCIHTGAALANLPLRVENVFGNSPIPGPHQQLSQKSQTQTQPDNQQSENGQPFRVEGGKKLPLEVSAQRSCPARLPLEPSISAFTARCTCKAQMSFAVKYRAAKYPATPFEAAALFLSITPS